MDEKQIGVICEQGDLGLGFTPITEDEQKTIQNNDKDKEEKK